MADSPSPSKPDSRPAPIEVVVRRSHPAALVSGGARVLRNSVAAATSLLGGLYATGARSLLDRSERLEDRLAERQARRHARAKDISAANKGH